MCLYKSNLGMCCVCFIYVKHIGCNFC
uniref:Uncharacterized protein n=1 Tax=Anguilla anguilla TaxID=7936 RepID=A0A0E9S7G9_ANGAN